MSNPTERIPFEFEVKGEQQLLTAFEKAVVAYNKIDQVNKSVATSYTSAEKAATSYERALKAGSDSAKRAQASVDSLREAYNKNTQAQKQSGGKGGSLGFDKGDLLDVASNLENLAGTGGKVTSVLRDLATSGGIAGAVFIALSAGLNLAKEALDNETKAFESQRIQIARTSSSLEEYIQRRNEAAKASPLGALATGIDTSGRTSGRESVARDAAVSERTQRETIVNDERRARGELALGQLQTERIKKLGVEVIKLGEQGASLEDIFNKTVEIKIATGEIEKLTSDNADEVLRTARGYQAVAQAQHGAEIVRSAPNLIAARNEAQANRASEIANQYATQLQDLQAQRNKSLQDAAAQHEAKLNDIAKAGAAQRLSIQESYSKQLASAVETLSAARVSNAERLNESRAQAVSDTNEKLAELERSTQETRTKQTEDFSKRNADIEERYQAQVKSINSNYADSLDDIVARRDARALVNARKARDKQLTEAESTRTKDQRAAAVDYQSAQRDLQKSLDTQRESIKRDYDKRLREADTYFQKAQQAAQQAYAKQIQQANQARAEQLNALQRSLSEQRTAEAQSYRERNAALQTSFAERLSAIGQALAREKDLSVQYGKQIIDSFKKVLNADEVRKVVGAFQDALQAKVDIKITPIAATTSAGGSYGVTSGSGFIGVTAYQTGGYNERARLAQLHANEVVLPLANPTRTQQLINQYVAPRTGMVGGGSQSISINGRIAFDGAAVTSQMQQAANQQIIAVIQESLKGIKLGVRT